jgi:hypothetical protein
LLRYVSLLAPGRYSVMHGIRKVNDPNRLQPQLGQIHLDLHLGEAVLPDGNVRSDTILAVVEEDDHAVGVH